METLLVEDDATTRRYLSELLTAAGHIVTAVDNVDEALARHAECPFPLIVTDWLMAGDQPDGLELCRAVRQGPNGDEVFILVVTVRDQTEDLETVLDAGADDYIAKPVAAPHLRIRLRVARERVHLRRERRDALRALRTVVQHAPLLLLMTDGDGRFTFAEGRGLRTIQNGAGSILGRTPGDVSPDLPQLQQCMERARAGETFVQEIGVGDVTLEAWCAPAPAGSVNAGGVIMVCSDVSQRKHAEEAAREGEERFRRFSEAAFEGIAVVREGIVTDANDQCARIMGYTPTEFRGTSMREIIHPDDFEKVREFIETTPDEPIHHRAVRKDGSEFTAEVRIRPMRLNGEDVVVAAVQDLTLREQAAAERNTLKERLEQAKRLEALGVMAGGIAHDFNNLLMGVLGNASLAVMEAGPDSEVAAYVGRIEESARRATDLTNQMLAFSGRSVLEVRPVDLSKLIRSITTELQDRVAPRVGIAFDVPASLPMVQADSRHIVQAVHGLVANANESYGDQVGQIHIRAGIRQVDGTVLERASASAGDAFVGERICIDVEDQGCGMDMKTVNRIFDPFFSTKFTGRGIGLAAVMGTMRSHGGSICVNSAPGKGTTVSMYFPIHTDEPAAAPTAPPATSQTQGRQAVLVIDDEPGVRDVTRVMLEKHGYEVITAETGQSGVDAFDTQRQSVAVTLLDLTMPDMSGATVFKRMKEIDPSARVVLMSGWDEEQATKDFSKSGLAGFLHKPFTASALIQKIEEFAQSRAS